MITIDINLNIKAKCKKHFFMLSICKLTKIKKAF